MSDAMLLACAYRERYVQACRMGKMHLPLTLLYKERMDFWSDLAEAEVFEDVEYDVLVRVKKDCICDPVEGPCDWHIVADPTRPVK